jgi:hypothetical protein
MMMVMMMKVQTLAIVTVAAPVPDRVASPVTLCISDGVVAVAERVQALIEMLAQQRPPIQPRLPGR